MKRGMGALSQWCALALMGACGDCENCAVSYAAKRSLQPARMPEQTAAHAALNSGGCDGGTGSTSFGCKRTAILCFSNPCGAHAYMKPKTMTRLDWLSVNMVDPYHPDTSWESLAEYHANMIYDLFGWQLDLDVKPGRAHQHTSLAGSGAILFFGGTSGM